MFLDLSQDVSYSRHASGKRKKYKNPYNIILNIVSDADRLESLGKIGVVRCL
jgi:hypothetical protein